MRIISLSFIFAGMNIAFQGIFQALDAGLESLVISLLRQLILILPAAWGFAQIAREDSEKIWLVWLTFLIAEAASCIFAAFFMKRIHSKVIETLDDPA